MNKSYVLLISALVVTFLLGCTEKKETYLEHNTNEQKVLKQFEPTSEDMEKQRRGLRPHTKEEIRAMLSRQKKN